MKNMIRQNRTACAQNIKSQIQTANSCGTSLITQFSWVFHFHLTEICQLEMFCTTVVTAQKGHLGGCSPEIFLHD